MGNLPAENPLRRLLGMNAGAVVDRQYVGIDVDDQLQLGAGEHDRVRAVLLLHRDHRLQRALGVARDFAQHELVVDDPVERLDVVEVGRQQVHPCATSRRR